MDFLQLVEQEVSVQGFHWAFEESGLELAYMTWSHILLPITSHFVPWKYKES